MKTFTNFTTKDGLSNNSVFSIVEDKKETFGLGPETLVYAGMMENYLLISLTNLKIKY